MARQKHVTPITVEEKQAIINDSVQTLSNKPVMSGEDLKKQFVSPIVNVDGRANIGDVVDRIAIETEAALDEIDGIAGAAAETAKNTQDDLTAHKEAYETHLSDYETYKTAQEQKDKSQDKAISDLGKNKQDNLVIDGGYSQNNPVATVNTVNGKLRPIEQAIPQLGATLSMSIDPLTYVLTVQLKNKSGEVVSTVNSDLPLEEMVVDARLGDDEKTIVLELKNGNSVSFSVAALVDGLISKEAFETALAKKADKLNGKNVLMGTDSEGNQKEYSVSSVGTNVYVDGERVEEFNADTKADKEVTERALAERIELKNVGIAGGVASLNEEGKVPKSQLPASVGGLDIGETYDTAFAGDRGATLEKRVDTLYKFHEEAGDIIVTPISTAFNERTTANGANVVDGSLAVLKRVEGNTVAVGEDENGLNGTLVNASFKGITSTGKNLFDISKISVGTPSNKYISEVTDNSITIITTGVSSDVSTGKTLKSVCPSLNAGQTVYLNAVSSGAKYIYISGVGTWTFGSAKTITQAMLDGIVSFYGNGEADKTVTTIISDIQVTFSSGVEYELYKESRLEFPESVPTPLGTTIDFEQKKIFNYGVELVLTEEFINNTIFNVISAGFLLRNILPNDENLASGVANINYPVGGNKQPRISVGIPSYPTSILLQGFNVAEIAGTTIAECKEWLLSMARNGNPVTIRYISSELQPETPFTEAQLLVGDNYIVSPQGTETVLGNDGAEYDAENKPTIEYVIKAGA